MPNYNISASEAFDPIDVIYKKTKNYNQMQQKSSLNLLRWRKDNLYYRLVNRKENKFFKPNSNSQSV